MNELTTTGLHAGKFPAFIKEGNLEYVDLVNSPGAKVYAGLYFVM